MPDTESPVAQQLDEAQPVRLERVGAVTLMRLTAGENRFNPGSIAAINEALDEVEAAEGPAAVVLTGTGKFFSNGLDLDWMASVTPEEADALLRDVHRLFARLLTYPVATVAAINGHAFAAGAMLALACDFRVMREDRGYFCVPEVDLGLPFTPGMTALLTSRLTAPTAREAMLTGRRYGGPDALAAGIVDECRGDEDVVPAALQRAEQLAGKPRATLASIKAGLYADAVRILTSG